MSYKTTWFMHGDVCIFKEDRLPEGFSDFEESKDKCLAYGEVTGHAHRLYGDGFILREDQKSKVKYLRVVEPTALRHEEHKEIILPPGDYRIGIQREYDHFREEIRSVAD